MMRLKNLQIGFNTVGFDEAVTEATAEFIKRTPFTSDSVMKTIAGTATELDKEIVAAAIAHENRVVRERMTVTYDPKDVTVTIGPPQDADGNEIRVVGGDGLFPCTVNSTDAGSFVFTKLTPYTVTDNGRLALRHDAAIDVTGKNAGQIANAMTQWAYPLYCVDRGARVDPESQYRGPYTTHDEALSNTEDPRDLVRRCRQLRPSEIAFDRDVASLAEFEVFSALVDELDEAATSGNLPEGAWSRIRERTVFDKYDDGTFPTARNYDTWVDDHLSVDAWICEGDE
jgi:hypothetical protein